MLKNYKERKEYLKKYASVTLKQDNLMVKTVQINEGIYYNKLYIRTLRHYPDDCIEFVCRECYTTDNDNNRIIFSTGNVYPDSDSQAVTYLKDHREEEFVKGLVL